MNNKEDVTVDIDFISNLLENIHINSNEFEKKNVETKLKIEFSRNI